MIKHHRLLLYIILFISGCLQPAVREKLPDLELYRQILAYSHAEEYDRALSLLENFLENTPDFERGYNTLAALYTLTGRLNEGEHFFSRLGSRYPSLPYCSYGIGLIQEKKNDTKSAIESYKKAAAVSPDFNNSYIQLGVLFAREEKTAEGEAFFREMMVSSPGSTGPYLGLGIFYKKISEKEKSSLMFEKTLKSDPANLPALKYYGNLYSEMGNWEKARDLWTQMYDFAGEIGDNYYMTHALRSLAHYHKTMGNLTLFKENIEKALLKVNNIFNPPLASLLHGDLGFFYFAGNSIEKSKEHLLLALELSQKLDEKIITMDHYSKLGHCALFEGKFDKAAKYYKKNYNLALELNDKKSLAYHYIHTGTLFLIIGKYHDAIKDYKKSLKINQNLGSKEIEGKAAHHIGEAYTLLKEYNRAIPFLKKCVKLNKTPGLTEPLSMNYVSLTDSYAALGDLKKAAEYIDKAFALAKKIENMNIKTRIYFNYGAFQTKIAQYDKAIKALHIAGDLVVSRNEISITTNIMHELGKAYFKNGDYDNALIYYKKALETLNNGVANLSRREQKEEFLALWHVLYEEIISLLQTMHQWAPEKGFDQLAFTYSEASKARSFLDLLENNRTGQPLTEKEQKKVKTLKTYSGGLNLNELQKDIIDEQTLFLEYKVTEESLICFRITNNSFKIITLDITRNELEEAVSIFRDCLEPYISESIYIKYGYSLYNLIVEPVIKDSREAGKKKLLVVPDGILNYVPFETLITEAPHSGAAFSDLSYLIKKYAVQYIHSGGVLKALRKKTTAPPGKELLAFGNPLISQTSKSGNTDFLRSIYPGENSSEFSNLTYTLVEVDKLKSLFKKNEVFTGKQALEETVKKTCAREGFRYIHFATHGLFNETRPELSGLLLSGSSKDGENGFLQVKEIFNMKLETELVVLSACKTGLGKLVKGEGFIGLTRAFMFAGAPSVVASLWSVEDKSTATLMTEFYKGLKSGGNKAIALREAKRRSLENPDYSHPFFWGGFVLIGEE